MVSTARWRPCTASSSWATCSGAPTLIEVACTMPRSLLSRSRTRTLGRGRRAWGHRLRDMRPVGAVGRRVALQLPRRGHRPTQLGCQAPGGTADVHAISDRHPFSRAQIATRFRTRSRTWFMIGSTTRMTPLRCDDLPFFHQCPVLRSISSRRHASEIDTPWRMNRTKCSRLSVIGCRPGRPLEADLIATCLPQA